MKENLQNKGMPVIVGYEGLRLVLPRLSNGKQRYIMV